MAAGISYVSSRTQLARRPVPHAGAGPKTLLAAQRLDGIAARSVHGGHETGDEGQQHADEDEYQCCRDGQGEDSRDVHHREHDGIHGQRYQRHENDGEDTGHEALYDRLGIEDVGNVALARAHGAQDTDFLLAFEHADVGDDADHDRTHDERDGDERDEHHGDHVDDVGDGAHERAHDVGVGDGLVLLARGFHVSVVLVDDVLDDLFVIEALGVDAGGNRVGYIGIAQGLQVVLVAQVVAAREVHEHGGELVLVHVDGDGLGEHARVDRYCRAHSSRERGGHRTRQAHGVALQHAAHLALQIGHELGGHRRPVRCALSDQRQVVDTNGVVQ